jgi:TRAP-type C4-dicarboxylate transport system permease large subunit
MNIKADRAAAEISKIADVAASAATLIPAIINLLNQYPHSTRAAIVAFASALGTVRQS